MDLVFAFAWLPLLTKPRGRVKLWIQCRRATTLEISLRVEAYGPPGPMASPYQLPAKAGKAALSGWNSQTIQTYVQPDFEEITAQVQGQLV